METRLDPSTGDYTDTRTTGLENAVYVRLTTPLGSWLYNPLLGSRLHELPRKDTEEVRALAESYAWQALQPLVSDGRATSVTVSATRRRAGWIDMSIVVERPDGGLVTYEHPVRVV
ncbi:phage GP46 family protein [Trabulsiella odontotermitis]|uniref:Phage GP46 family protein n=1 Tax=Trabulsiella odontotermitis TaxID=379893 RepID=A0A0L0GQ75_9ENTR|nr:phage GP46 family protein [Trabulsiella odontotermitis]KNC91097.1 hypothetical protein GM31_02695 [Trabulsiella odontotermitis]